MGWPKRMSRAACVGPLGGAIGVGAGMIPNDIGASGWMLIEKACIGSPGSRRLRHRNSSHASARAVADHVQVRTLGRLAQRLLASSDFDAPWAR
jgi:hypothetical protein